MYYNDNFVCVPLNAFLINYGMGTACYILNICTLLSFFDTFTCLATFDCVNVFYMHCTKNSSQVLFYQIWWLGAVTTIQIVKHLNWPFKLCITSYVFASYINFAILLLFLKKNIPLLIFFSEIKIILKKIQDTYYLHHCIAKSFD